MFLNFIGEHDGWCDCESTYNIKTKNNEKKIYLLNNDKVLKLYISINDKNLIYKDFELLKNNLPKKDFIYVDYDDFRNFNFPLPKYEFKHNNIIRLKYKVPNKNSLNSTLLYILTDIYNNEISSEVLEQLSEEYKFRYNECNNMDKLDRTWIEVIQNIINNLNIEIEEEYDYNVFKQSVDFIEVIREKELIPSIEVLYKLNQILTSAKENKEIFDSLKININEEKQLRK